MSPGYFRLYGSTIVELGRRGWEVLLAFDKPDRRGDAPRVPAGARDEVRSVGATPAVRERGAIAFAPPGARLPALPRAALFHRQGFFGAAPRSGCRRRCAGSSESVTCARWCVGAAIRGGGAIEAAVPSDPRMREFVRSPRPTSCS